MQQRSGLTASLRAERARRDWNQQQAAEFFGVSRPTYQRLERAHPEMLEAYVTVGTMRRIALFLDVPERSVLDLIPHVFDIKVREEEVVS